MLYETIIYEAKDGVATITLNRPDAANALNDTMAGDLLDALQQAGTDPSIRALLITAAGKAFCAGQDLKAVPGTRSIAELLATTWNPIVRGIRELLPALDAVAALCLGGNPAAAAALGGPFTGDRVVDASDTLSGLR